LLSDSRHTGIDFAGPEGTPVYSATDGVVIRVEHGKHCNDLNCLSTVAIYNEATDVTFIYLHMRDIKVKLKDKVRAGARIGAIGSRGPGGIHLHFEARPGEQFYAALDVRRTTNPYDAAKKAREDISLIFGRSVAKYEGKTHGKEALTREFTNDGTLIATMTTYGNWEVKGSNQIVLSHDAQFFPGSSVVDVLFQTSQEKKGVSLRRLVHP